MWSATSLRLYGYAKRGPGRNYETIPFPRQQDDIVFFGVLTGRRKGAGTSTFVEVSILKNYYVPRERRPPFTLALHWTTPRQGWLLLSSVEDPQFRSEGFPWVDR